MQPVVGRAAEKEILTRISESKEAELVAVYGRRRVGKTYLIRNVYEKQLLFELSGIHHGTLDQQLENFTLSLSKASGFQLEKPVNWIRAFYMLQEFLAPKIKRQRRIIFFDEFPWIHTARSGFLSAFESFWNSWASRQQNLVVVICGSAAAWMIQKVINNKGGLHNRVTQRLRLLPFTIGETKDYLRFRKINLDHYQIVQLYMAMGGIPQYLREIKPGESASQAIDRICFGKDGFLKDEFKNLFYSLFDNATDHINVIKALARKGTGLTRNEVIETCKLSSGGGATQLLEELIESGFITAYIPFNRTAKDSIYKLTDEYSRFYIKFIETNKLQGTGSWVKFSRETSWKSWSGIAFENICMKHIVPLKKALGIEAVYTEISVWRYHPKKNEQGVQIDLLIDRQDGCINVCEMKFSVNEFELTKAYTKELENKMNVFKQHIETKKTLFLTLITTYGVKNAGNFAGFIQSQITMDALFT